MKDKIINIINILRELKNIPKILIGWVLMYLYLNIFSISFIRIFFTADGGIVGLSFWDWEGLVSVIGMFFVYWFPPLY